MSSSPCRHSAPPRVRPKACRAGAGPSPRASDWHNSGAWMGWLGGEGGMVAQKPEFNLSPDTFVKPDILVHPDGINTYDLQSADAWLVVEVAETSLSYDLKTKLPLYASHGVPEYWVINAATLVTTVHRQPTGNAYAVREEVPSNMRLVPSLAPELAVSLGELDLD